MPASPHAATTSHIAPPPPAAVEVPAVEVRALDAHYGETQVLYDLNFSIRSGEIMVIMGGSGSGKSTFLRHLIGLERPSSGSIHLLGRDITRLGPVEMLDQRRRIGVLHYAKNAAFLTKGIAVQFPVNWRHWLFELWTSWSRLLRSVLS